MSLLGIISVIKMNILFRVIFFIQTIAVLKSDLPFKQKQKDISKFEWQSKKLRVKNKILQN